MLKNIKVMLVKALLLSLFVVFVFSSLEAEAAIRCCYNRAYNTTTHGCCMSGLYIKNSELECCGNAFYYQSDPNKACCAGKTLYNPNTQICCKARVYTNSNQGCCGGTLFDTSTQTCCGAEVLEGVGACCKDSKKWRLYNPLVECCPDPNAPSQLQDPTQKCCNGITVSSVSDANNDVAFKSIQCCNSTHVLST